MFTTENNTPPHNSSRHLFGTPSYYFRRSCEHGPVRRRRRRYKTPALGAGAGYPPLLPKSGPLIDPPFIHNPTPKGRLPHGFDQHVTLPVHRSACQRAQCVISCSSSLGLSGDGTVTCAPATKSGEAFTDAGPSHRHPCISANCNAPTG